ncbi:MAG: hypothetical protein ACO2PO_13610 [Candidatus Calescibacterium sp.]
MENHQNLLYYFLLLIFHSVYLIIFTLYPGSGLSQERNQREKEIIEVLNSIRSDIQRINKDVSDMSQSILRMNEKIKDYQLKTQTFESSVSSVLSDIGNVKKVLDNVEKEVINLKSRPDLSGKVEDLERRLNFLSVSLKFIFGGLIISLFFSFLSLILSVSQGRRTRRGLRF